MARVFKQTYTKPLPDGAELLTRKGKRVARFKNRKGKTVTAPLSKDGTKVILETAKFYIEYRDADDIVRRVPGYTDEKATEQEAARLEREAAQRKTGLIDRHVEYRQRLLSGHLGDWEEALKAKGNTEKHASEQARRARHVFDGCKFKFWPDIAATKVQVFVADMRKDTEDTDGISARTGNCYLQACKQFGNWMVKNDRAPINPLTYLQRYKADPKVKRRALTIEECRQLLKATEKAGLNYGMTGRQRAMMYRVAVGTGFRAAEIRSLTPKSFDFDGDHPTITVEAAYSKNRTRREQPIAEQLACDLATFLADLPPDVPVFAPHADKTADMLRDDLALAGIEAENSAGYRVDFHALRHTYITLGAMAGITPKVLMDLARHSDINLTMRAYSHTVVADRAKALEAVPDLTSDGGEEREALKATGTCDEVPAVVPFPACDDKHNDKNLRPSSQVTTPPGTRTPDPLIKSQLLCQLS